MSTLVNLQYGYDRASNRKHRRDEVSRVQSTPKYFDELYGYDGMNQLTSFARGELNVGNTTIGSPTLGQGWTLDPTGNWQGFAQTVADPLTQTRTHTVVNEIDGIGETEGDQWPTPGYDNNGNTTSFPDPRNLETGLTATYDAWNRLVKLTDTGGTVAEYEYDGLNRRITKTVGSNLRHYYFSDRWQVLEERVGSATSADRQYVWGLRYVDDLVLRDRTSERLYALQDALFNVVALTDDTGSVKERFAYQPYGKSEELNPDFATYSGTDYEWEYRFTGRELDLESGLQLNRNRYLHLELGRWLTRDPIGYGGGMNLFGYVEGMPTYYVDSTGLQFKPGQQPIEYIPGIPSIIEGTVLEEVPYPEVPLRPPVGKCTIRVCSKPIGGGAVALGSHIDIFLDGDLNGSEQSYQFMGGPSPELPRCKGLITSGILGLGQLIAAGKPLDADFQDHGELHPERCKEIDLGESCDRVFNCFGKKIQAINDSCIAYKPSPLPILTGCSNGVIGGCNSNCVASWLLEGCLSNPPALPVYQLVGGIPAGWGMPAPDPVAEAH